ncbi:MAG: thioredoxin domain-containing protein [Myxococcota bacterium]|jgi:hypothetical protein
MSSINKLAGEKSPYLLQHAGNPVDWMPWGEEAFEKAHSLDRPIFLSVGYSTCHWCHVMARESFEDPEVASLINEAFVPVKVDREERPDVDAIYMTVCQMLTGSGGWPLTIVMTPDREPFFAATYIPKHRWQGMPGLLDLIPRISMAWKERHDEVAGSARSIVEALARKTGVSAGELNLDAARSAAFRELHKTFDAENGGFGGAPRFPTPQNVIFLLGHHRRTGNETALGMALQTLDSMRNGGMFDHIGYGFHRYSTDPAWRVPHFEKMLYDQALLALAYLEAFEVTGDGRHAKVAREIFTYVTRDLAEPGGAFYTAEDADSGGVEGAFYMFTGEDLSLVLPPQDAAFARRLFNITPGGNNPFITAAAEDLAAGFGISVEEVKRKTAEVRDRLYGLRSGRPRPHLDDKVLTDWNALMILALARGGRILKDERLTARAEGAYGFIKQNMIRGDGVLMHRWRLGETAVPGRLDDYVFLARADLELFDATGKRGFLDDAATLAGKTLALFGDGTGGLYLSPAGEADLIARMRVFYDGAVPSGNSIAVDVLGWLCELTGERTFGDAATSIVSAAALSAGRSPTAHLYLINALSGPACCTVGGSCGVGANP